MKMLQRLMSDTKTRLAENWQETPATATDLIYRCLNLLDAEEKELLRLVLWTGARVPDAGEELGMDSDEAHKTYERALRRLRKLLRVHSNT